MGLGTVTSVSFTGDGVVLAATADTPVTGSGTLTPSLVSQAKNVVLAGPSSGGSALCRTFRALVAADLPAIPNALLVDSSVTVTAGTGMSGGGAVSLGDSVTLSNAGVTAFTGDGTVLSNSASTAGVTATLALQAANTVLSGPSTGSSTAPTFRTLVAADIPDLTTNRVLSWFLGVTVNGLLNPVAVATNPASIYLICSKAGTFTRALI